MQTLKATINDAEEILKLQKEAYQSEAALYKIDNFEPLQQTVEEIKDQFKTYVFLKAVDNGRIVGTVRAYEKEGTCHIGKLAVLPKMQNIGIGKELMRNIESRFKGSRFELFTGTKSLKNIDLYKKLGYSAFKNELDGCGGIEIVYMEKHRPKH
jgi:N-acetylglutamate synthase-like GNAT family acetyltransferase